MADAKTSEEKTLEALTIDHGKVKKYIDLFHEDTRKKKLDLHYTSHMSALDPVTKFLEKFETKKKAEDEKWNFTKLKDEDVFDIVGQYLFGYLEKLEHKDIATAYSKDFDKMKIEEKSNMLQSLTHDWMGDAKGEFLSSLIERVKQASQRGESATGIQAIINATGLGYVGREELGGKEAIYKSEIRDKYQAAFDKKAPGTIAKYLSSSDPEKNPHFHDIFKPYAIDEKSALHFENIFQLHPEKGIALLNHLVAKKHKRAGNMSPEEAKEFYLTLKDAEYAVAK